MKSAGIRRPWAVSCVIACLLPLLVGGPIARGDGECFAGYRDTTDAERNEMTTVLQAARAAMPTTPDGWILEGDDQLSVMAGLCRDYERGPWGYGHARSFQRVDDRNERDAMLRTAGETMAADFEAKKGRMEILMARTQELAEKAMAAQQRGDYDGVDAVNREMEAVSKEIEALYAEGDADDQVRAAQVAASKDTYLYVSVTFNATTDAPGHEARSWRPANFAGTAFRWTETHDVSELEQALFLVGRWTGNGDGTYSTAPNETLGPTAPQSIVVRVTADASRLEETVAAIDFEALSGLLAR